MKNCKKIFALNWRTIVCFVFINMIFSFYAYPKGGGTPYSVFYGMWLEHVKDSTEFTLLTVIPGETLSEISPLLKKALKVKSDITCDSTASVGGTLTKLLKEKYAKKSNEKNDFLAIQYSTSSSDFADYLIKWPDSKYAEEAKARLECFKANELWLVAKETKSRETYERFAQYCADHAICEFEGCQRISKTSHDIGTAICDWYSIIDRSNVLDCSIYKDYSDYIEKYGRNSLFGNDASDSLQVNKDRYDWNIAVMEDTPNAYKEYIDNHGDGKHVRKAEALIKELELWNIAAKSDGYDDYCAYYSEYPDGKYAEEAAEKMKRHEEPLWEITKKSNTLKAYEDFVRKYPSGFYASDAQNLITEMRLAPYLKNPPSFNSISTVGYYSHPGYSLVCLGNIDKSTTITVSLNGPTGFSKTIRPGGREWVRVKNGSYKILVQASNVQNWWGNASLENHMYADAWATTSTFNGISIGSNKDEAAFERLLTEIKAKAAEEEINTLIYILKGE